MLKKTNQSNAGQDDGSLEIEKTRDALRQNYLADSRPWVVAYSGGKDSTLVLQLVYELLLDLADEDTLKPIYVIASDTRVEAPNIEDYLKNMLDQISTHAKQAELPVQVHLVTPPYDNGFWSNLIGKGYPAPTRWFRWCTTKIKIIPAKKIIEDITKKNTGNVVLLLGTRRAESQIRSRSMEARVLNSRGLNPHHEIPNALVLAPIAEWKSEQVWKYLENNPPPWGGSHDFMLDLYRQASGGECPVIFDLNTPSCGNSRFGCWTCTVVKLDKSMQGFIESGETWMLPLNEFRNWLKEIRENPRMRMKKRRDGTKGPGPFTPEARKEILERLLETERKTGRILIHDQEIAFIQTQWNKDFDVSNSAYNIATRYGRKVENLTSRDIIHPKDRELMQELLDLDYELQEKWVEDLLYLVTDKYPTLDERGSRQKLEKDVEQIIENAVKQHDLADSEQ